MASSGKTPPITPPGPPPGYPPGPPPGNPPEPPPGYPPRPHPVQQQLSNSMPAPGVSMLLGPASCRVTCRFCHAEVLTRITKEPSILTHVIAIALCCILCPCFCCCFGLIPYCIESLHSTKHFCPHCNGFVGTYQ